MDKIDIYSNNVLDNIIKIILKYCPLTDNRIDLMDNARTSPEMDINIYTGKHITDINFLYGNSNVKTSTSDRLQINGNISISDVIGLIDYLLQDHECISHIGFCKLKGTVHNNGTNEIKMVFKINWSDKSLKGLNVGDIVLTLNLGKDDKLASDYALVILSRYKDILEKTQSYKNMKERYITGLKKEMFSSLSKEELLELISTLSESDLKELLESMDNKIFEKYFLIDNSNVERRIP